MIRYIDQTNTAREVRAAIRSGITRGDTRRAEFAAKVAAREAKNTRLMKLAAKMRKKIP